MERITIIVAYAINVADRLGWYNEMYFSNNAKYLCIMTNVRQKDDSYCIKSNIRSKLTYIA